MSQVRPKRERVGEIAALISFNRQLALVGFQLRILNGVVSLLTTRRRKQGVGRICERTEWRERKSSNDNGTLEVLACIAFRQPISQAEIDQLFDSDKRGLVVKLRNLKLVQEFAAMDGRLRFATTEAFLQRFGLASLQELTAASALG
jgi:chromosome segregation and condensation protein ScpB